MEISASPPPSISDRFRLSVCLFFFVLVLAISAKNCSTGLHKNFVMNVALDKKVIIKFWKSSDSDSKSRTESPWWRSVLFESSVLTQKMPKTSKTYIFRNSLATLLTFIANVNSRSLSPYVIARPSVCRLSSVTFVHPTAQIPLHGHGPDRTRHDQTYTATWSPTIKSGPYQIPLYGPDPTGGDKLETCHVTLPDP